MYTRNAWDEIGVSHINEPVQVNLAIFCVDLILRVAFTGVFAFYFSADYSEIFITPKNPK